MAFPTNLTNAVDGVTDVMADHINNLEAKVGIDGSLVATSLDYLLRNPASVDPGHRHSIYQVAGSYITALTGDIAASGPGSAAATIQAGAVSLSKIANLPANSIIGNNTAAPATPLALSVAQVKTLLSIAQADVVGLNTADSPTFAGVTAPSLTSPGALGLNASGTNQNITLTPSGSGYTILNGNVGIGKTNPGQKLHIYSPSSATLRLEDSTGFMDVFNTGVNLTYRSGSVSGTVNWCLSDNTTALACYLGSKRFGIATAGPTATLTVQKYLTYDLMDISNSTPGDIFKITNSGNVGIGIASPTAAALLHLSSTTKGFLPPVMTTAQKTAISSPPAGLVVYDSTLNKLCVYTGAAWQTITSA